MRNRLIWFNDLAARRSTPVLLLARAHSSSLLLAHRSHIGGIGGIDGKCELSVSACLSLDPVDELDAEAAAAAPPPALAEAAADADAAPLDGETALWAE